MKSIKPMIVVLSLALFGAGCTVSGPTIPAAGMPTDGGKKMAETSDAVCAQTPQVYYFNKLAFSASELSSIQTNVVAPMVEYYRTLPDSGYEIVSFMIKRNATGIVVDAIIDQPDSDDPVYEGFVLDRQKDGTYPRWYPEEVPPEYRG